MKGYLPNEMGGIVREFEFRARHKQTGEWYYGSLNPDKRLHQCIDLSTFWWWIETGVLLRETMGQATGLPDKNKKEIYEGDIVKVSGFSEPMEVYFKDGYFGWGKKHGGMYSFDPFGTEDLEVIGNIYEHSYLLDKKTENEASLL